MRKAFEKMDTDKSAHGGDVNFFGWAAFPHACSTLW